MWMPAVFWSILPYPIIPNSAAGPVMSETPLPIWKLVLPTHGPEKGSPPARSPEPSDKTSTARGLHAPIAKAVLARRIYANQLRDFQG
jgi:hypothetical protein